MFFNPIFIWAVIGLLFIGAEFFIPGLVIIFFGAGALLTSILTAIVPGLRLSVALQIIIWLASSGLSLGLLRKYFSKVFRGKTITDDGQEPSGKTATVTERITPDVPGRVHFQGTSWTAMSYSEIFEPGAVVEILKEEGLTLIVTKSILDSTILEIDEENESK
ncbi:MAG: NfeD family protein [Spirochaetales bacterium]|nr:NfeD family protein [Spirochaetales bacterium]